MQAEQIIRELERRASQAQVGFNLVDPSFVSQASFIQDQSRMKAAFCTRRSGKSYGAGIYLLQEALSNPHSTCIYIALTRESAKRILWAPILKELNRKHHLGIRFQETELACYLPNGSVIYLVGMDTDEQQKAKLLGQKYRLCIVDEAASFGIDLKELVYGVLKPAVADMNGTICLIGTPGNITRGLFYDITMGNEPGWSLHRWTADMNPFMAKQWAIELEEIKRDRPLFMETTLFKQHYLGQWVIEEDKLVYRFNKGRQLENSLPSYLRGNWTYVLGIDLGFNDDSAFVLCAYHDHDPCLHIIEVYKQPGMDLTDVANKIKWYDKRYDVTTNVIDGAAKQAVAEMQNRHDVALRIAEKQGKADFIQLLNAEAVQGRIKLMPGTEPLQQEWEQLIWKDDERKEEHPASPNHLADAALYAWRYCYPHLSSELKLRPRPGSQEWYKTLQPSPEEQAIEMEQQVEQQEKELQEAMGFEISGLDPSEDMWV